MALNITLVVLRVVRMQRPRLGLLSASVTAHSTSDRVGATGLRFQQPGAKIMANQSTQHLGLESVEQAYQAAALSAEQGLNSAA